VSPDAVLIGARIRIKRLEEEIAGSKAGLRDKFAMAAMQSLIINKASLNPNANVVDFAYKYADMMLSRREWESETENEPEEEDHPETCKCEECEPRRL